MSSNQKSQRRKLRDQRVARALSVLGDHPSYGYLTQPTPNGMHKNKILAELGKRAEESEIREFATRICLTRATTQTALAKLRGQSRWWSPGSTEELAAALAGGIKAYGGQHTGLTQDTIEEALALILLDSPFKPRDASSQLPQRDEALTRSREIALLRCHVEVIGLMRQAPPWRLSNATEPRPRPVQPDQTSSTNVAGRSTIIAERSKRNGTFGRVA